MLNEERFHKFVEKFYQFEILTPPSHLTNIYSHKKGTKFYKIINKTLLIICYNTSNHSKVNILYN